MLIIVVSGGNADLMTQPGLGTLRDQGAKDQPKLLFGPNGRKKRRKRRGRRPDKDPER